MLRLLFLLTLLLPGLASADGLASAEGLPQAEDLLKKEEFKGWQYRESLTMKVESLDAVSGRLDLTELTAIPVEESKE